MDEIYDVAVIGGGVNGTGIARDCALRGLTTILIEKKDLAAGASGASSGMIHGGLRYMINDLGTTKRSCLDSGYIQSICPHLLFRIPFVMLIPKRKKIYMELAETYLEAYDWFAPLKRGKPHIRLSADDVRRIEPGIAENIHGGVMFDEWGIDGPRLCVLNALSARDHGAAILTHTAVTGIIVDRSRHEVRGVTISNAESGGEEEIRARVVVNAGGPWLPHVARMAGLNVKIRPGKGIHLVLDRRISSVGFLSGAIDGRSIFIIPHENTSLVGTTDDDYYGDPDALSATEDEVEYLLEGMGRVFPSLAQARIVTTTIGIRPTLYQWGKYEDDLYREHRIYDHGVEDGLSGLITIAGGKLASYRLMSEETTDLVCKKLGLERPCRTHSEPLPGSEEPVDSRALAASYGIHPYAAARLVYRHGCRAVSILRLCKENTSWASFVCPCEPVTEAEVRWCIRNEWARTLDDLRRRTKLGAGPCQGMACAWKAAAILADELGLSPGETMRDMGSFLELGRAERAPILRGGQMAQEELLRSIYPPR